MTRFLLTYFFGIISFFGFSQEIIVKGIVLDSDSKMPIANVNVGYEEGEIEFKTKSNFSGGFQIPYI